MYKEMRNHIRRVERANSSLVKENRELKAKLDLYQRLDNIHIIELTPDYIKHMVEGDKVWCKIGDSKSILIGLKGAHHV